MASLGVIACKKIMSRDKKNKNASMILTFITNWRISSPLVKMFATYEPSYWIRYVVIIVTAMAILSHVVASSASKDSHLANSRRVLGSNIPGRKVNRYKLKCSYFEYKRTTPVPFARTFETVAVVPVKPSFCHKKFANKSSRWWSSYWLQNSRLNLLLNWSLKHLSDSSIWGCWSE